MSWLNAMGVHDFTGERAAAQWETWQEEKRQAQKGTQGQSSGFLVSIQKQYSIRDSCAVFEVQTSLVFRGHLSYYMSNLESE